MAKNRVVPLFLGDAYYLHPGFILHSSYLIRLVCKSISDTRQMVLW